MAKTRGSKSEGNRAASLSDRIAELEARLAAVEASLEAAAAVDTVLPDLPMQSAGPVHLTAGEPALTLGGGVTVPGSLGDGLAPQPNGSPLQAALVEPRAVGDDALAVTADVAPMGSDADDADSGSPGHELAAPPAPRKPIPFTPADLRARLGKPGGVLLTGTARLPKGVKAVWQREAATSQLLDAPWGAAAEPVAALAHPVRLALLREVLRGARSVSALASLPGLGTSGQLYHHLRPLLAEGWLRPVERGQYEVPEERVIPLLTIIAVLVPV